MEESIDIQSPANINYIYKYNLNIYYYITVVLDLIVESDIYEPCINDNGNYSDYLPSSSKFKNGLRCPCGTRKEHIFDTRQSFSGHVKTKTHQKWVSDLLFTNYFIKKGFEVVVVNNKNKIFYKDEWKSSETFSFRNQSGIIISDNQIRKYFKLDKKNKLKNSYKCWGVL